MSAAFSRYALPTVSIVARPSSLRSFDTRPCSEVEAVGGGARGAGEAGGRRRARRGRAARVPRPAGARAPRLRSPTCVSGRGGEGGGREEERGEVGGGRRLKRRDPGEVGAPGLLWGG